MGKSQGSFSNRMKDYESREAGRRFIPLMPVIARLDGRAFHSFCKGMDKPFDFGFIRAMDDTARFMLEETRALMAYVQSDEITLLWHSEEYKSQIFFDGRIQKMASILAALASVKFSREICDVFPDRSARMPVFDCRVWQVPNKTEAVNVFVWCEKDAIRNSIQAMAQSMYSSSELHGKGTAEQKKMVFIGGVDWDALSERVKKGAFYWRRKKLRKFSSDEIDKLPPKHAVRTNPDLMIERFGIESLEMPPLPMVVNRNDVFFDGADPSEG